MPALETAPHDPAGDLRALARLAEWCGRYTPWTAVDGCGRDPGGAAGILLDVTGCAHLFACGEGGGNCAGEHAGEHTGEHTGERDSGQDGEAALLADLTARMARLGFTARVAMAGTAGAAWAAARFFDAPPQAPQAARARRWTVVPPGGERAALVSLPPAALRLPPATVEELERLGLRRIGDLLALPPAALEPRFGPLPARRLAQALGREAEPISPSRPEARHLVRRAFAEPTVTAGDIAAGLEALVAGLCRDLAAAGRGARRLELVLYRVDGTLRRLALGTSRPSRDPAHLKRLFAEHLDKIDPGFGIEVMTLAASEAEPLDALQLALSGSGQQAAAGLPALIDRLGSRLGLGNVLCPAPRESHVPERAVALVPAPARISAWRPRGAAPPRPLRLLPRPEPVEAVALLPDHPPARFRWRRLAHRVIRAEGPERIGPEWWLDDPARAGTPARDYFRVEDEDGRGYWLYRADGRWFLHGLFG